MRKDSRMFDRNEIASRIPGWGVDLRAEDRPAYPKEKTPPHGTGAHWREPERMVPKVKIHVSPEHKGITPVFGTTCPPKGLSGKLRDWAYTYSEGRIAHWLILLMADRVDVIESAISSLLKGQPDNPLAEMGLKAELNRPGSLRRFQRRRISLAIAGTVPLLLAGSLLLRSSNSSGPSSSSSGAARDAA